MDGRIAGWEPKRPLTGAEDNVHRSKRFQASQAENGDMVCKVLCPEAKVGGVTGKGDSIMRQIMGETGAKTSVQAAEEDANGIGSAVMVVSNSQADEILQKVKDEDKSHITVLPKEQNHACADLAGEILEIQGNANVMQKAAGLVIMRLNNNSKEATKPTQISSVHSPDYNATTQDAFMPYQNSADDFQNLDEHAPAMISAVGFNRGLDSALGHPNSGYMLPESGRSLGSDEGLSSSGRDFFFRVVCSNEEIGGVIGVSGARISKLRDEYCGKIKIAPLVGGSPDRTISVSIEPHVGKLYSFPDAVARIQVMIVGSGPPGNPVATRLLVSPNQFNYLFGVNGSKICEMEKTTGARIQILSQKYLPPGSSETDTLVQIVGDTLVAKQALRLVTSGLLANFCSYRSISEVFPSSSFGSLATLSGRGRLEPEFPARSYPSSSVYQGGHSLSSYPTLSPPPGPCSTKSKHDMGSMGSFTDYEEPIVHKGRSSVFEWRSASEFIIKSTLEVVLEGHVIFPVSQLLGIGPSQSEQVTLCGATVELYKGPKPSSLLVKLSGTVDETPAGAERLYKLACNQIKTIV